jgi:hypothetical protein
MKGKDVLQGGIVETGLTKASQNREGVGEEEGCSLKI